MKVLLIADKGMVLTDGETYGKTIDPAEGKKPDDYHEITEAEYEKIMEEEKQTMEV